MGTTPAAKTYSTCGDSRACEDVSALGSIPVSVPHETILDAVEGLLDAASETDLSDRLYAAASRDGGDAGEGSVLRGVSWLYLQHFTVGGQPRPGKGLDKFLRRLRLLLQPG